MHDVSNVCKLFLEQPAAQNFLGWPRKNYIYPQKPDITNKPLYNTICYNMVLNKTQSKDESQKCIDYIEQE